jgi:hypothetical protein
VRLYRLAFEMQLRVSSGDVSLDMQVRFVMLPTCGQAFMRWSVMEQIMTIAAFTVKVIVEGVAVIKRCKKRNARHQNKAKR